MPARIPSPHITGRQWLAAAFGMATIATDGDAVGIEPLRVPIARDEVGHTCPGVLDT